VDGFDCQEIHIFETRLRMKLHAPWKDYEDSEVDRHETGMSFAPVVYVAHDRSCVWLVTNDSMGRQAIHIADADQISELWERLRLISLLSVLKVVDHPELGKDGLRFSRFPADATRPEPYRPGSFT